MAVGPVTGKIKSRLLDNASTARLSKIEIMKATARLKRVTLPASASKMNPNGVVCRPKGDGIVPNALLKSTRLCRHCLISFRRSGTIHLLTLLLLSVFALTTIAQTSSPGATKTAVFAGGCFWCIQPAFDKAPGVIKTTVGYCGGTEPNPTYELVGSEKTKYRESIEIVYDPAKISYEQLLDIYWKQIDPTQSDGQFTDVGPSYRAAVFYGNDEEKSIAEASKEKLARSGKFKKAVVTELLPAMKFWPAEDYHQKYYQQNPEHFEAFEHGSGRVSFQKKTWGEKP